MKEHYFSLSFHPIANETVSLLKEIVNPSVFEASDKNSTRKITLDKRYDCLIRILSSVITLTKLDLNTGLYRTHKTGSFSGSPVPYRVFVFVSNYLIEEGYLVKVQGNQSTGKATSYSITQKLVDFYLEAELKPNDFMLIDLVRARYPSQFNDKGKKVQGKLVTRINEAEGYEDEQRIVRGINDYLIKHTLSDIPFTGLFRSFSNYSDDKKRLTEGGRLYAEGGGYQSLKLNKRLKLKIDGEPVAEVDITASHFTLIYLVASMLDSRVVTVNFNEDPYRIKGIPRAVVKQWIVDFSAKLKPLTRWSSDSVGKLKEKGIHLVIYPVKDVGKAIMRKYPFLETLTSANVTWGYLQRREADAIIMTMRRLYQEHDVPAYPVHDSLIVKRSDVPLVERIMKESFSSIIGFTPILKVTTNQ